MIYFNKKSVIVELPGYHNLSLGIEKLGLDRAGLDSTNEIGISLKRHAEEKWIELQINFYFFGLYLNLV